MSTELGSSADITNEPLTREAGREVLRTALASGDVKVRELAKKLQWSFPRTYSMLKTLAKKQEKTLMKVKAGVYTINSNEEKNV